MGGDFMPKEIEDSYSVSEVAKYGNAYNRTVVNYDLKGWLGLVRRNERGHRRFSPKQRELFKKIFTRRNK